MVRKRAVRMRKEVNPIIYGIALIVLLVLVFGYVNYEIRTPSHRILSENLDHALLSEHLNMTPDLTLPLNYTRAHYENLSFVIKNRAFARQECFLTLKIISESGSVLNESVKYIVLESRQSAPVQFLFDFPEGDSTMDLQPFCRGMRS